MWRTRYLTGTLDRTEGVILNVECHGALNQLSENREKTSDSLVGSLPNPVNETQKHLARRRWEEEVMA